MKEYNSVVHFKNPDGKISIKFPAIDDIDARKKAYAFLERFDETFISSDIENGSLREIQDNGKPREVFWTWEIIVL